MADERVSIVIDIDVKDVAAIAAVKAALTDLDKSSNKASRSMQILQGQTTATDKGLLGAARSSQKFSDKLNQMSASAKLMQKMARPLLFTIIAMGLEFAITAASLASINLLFAVGKFAVKAYHFAMQGLAGAVAAVGVAALGAAAAFREFTAAQYAFRFKGSDGIGAGMADATASLNALYKDSSLATVGIQGLNQAFSAVAKNSAFTGRSQASLKQLYDFAVASGDTTKGLAAAGTFIGLLQKEAKFTTEALNAAKQISPEFDKAFKKMKSQGKINTVEDFYKMLDSGQLSKAGGVEGAAANVQTTLMAQFKGFMTRLYGEVAGIGQDLLDPFKKTLFGVFQVLRTTIRRVSGDLIKFGQGSFLTTIVSVTQKLADFSVMLLRKFLPATEGYFSRIGRFINSVERAFRKFVDVLRPLQDGARIINKTFGPAIVEIFKGFGRNIQRLGQLAVENKDKFLEFGESLKRLVASFFSLGAGFKEAFTEALPVINRVVSAIAMIVEQIANLFKLVGKAGPLGSFMAIFGTLALGMKGRRGRGRGMGGGIPGVGIPGVPGAMGGGSPMNPLNILSGAMGMRKGRNSAANSAAYTGGQSNSMSNAVISATGSTVINAGHVTVTGGSGGGRGPRGGGRGGQGGRRGAMPYSSGYTRPYGGLESSGPNPYMVQGRGGSGRRFGSGGRSTDRTSYENWWQGAIAKRQTDTIMTDGTRAVYPQSSLNNLNYKVGQSNRAQGGRFLPGGSAYEAVMNKKADRAAMQGGYQARNQTLPNFYKQQIGLSIGATRRRIGSLGSAAGSSIGAVGQRIGSSRPVTGLRGAMAPMGKYYSARGGNISLAAQSFGQYGRAGIQGGKNLLAKGGGSFDRFLTSARGSDNFKAAYKENLRQQGIQLAKQQAAGGPAGKLSKGKAMRAGLKGNFSGMGMVAGIAGSALASRFGSDEAQGSLQAGSALMGISPLLGVGVAGLGTANSAQTFMGGALAGGVGGAAMGAKLGSMIPGVGTAIGATVGAVVGTAFGVFKANSNKKKLAKQAAGQVSDANKFAMAEAMLLGNNESVAEIAGKNLAKFKKMSKDPAERSKQIDQMVKDGLITSGQRDRALSGGTGATDKSQTFVDELIKQTESQIKVGGLMTESYTKNMRGLKMATGMTEEELRKLASTMNVNLYDPTLKLTDAIGKLGKGMVRTAEEINNAVTDNVLKSLEGLENWVAGQKLAETVDASQRAFNSGAPSMDQFVSTVSELAAYTMKVNEKAPLLGVQSLMEMLTPGTPNYVFGPNGALGAGFGKLSPEVQAQYTEALNKNFIDPMIQSNAITATTQIGAKLADAGLGFATDTEGTELEKLVANKLKTGTDEEIGQINQFLKYGTLNGKTPEQAAAQILKLVGGTGLKLTDTSGAVVGPDGTLADGTTLAKFDTDTLAQMTTAVASGLNASPAWYEDVPGWWTKGLIAKTNSAATVTLMPNGDTSTPRGVGDTSVSKSLRNTLSSHRYFNGKLTGKRTITSAFRTNNLGSPSSDHATGRAYDLTGQNLGQYSRMINSSGGFAEFHGANANRHLHVVPPSGDTSSPRSGGSGSSAAAPNITVNVHASPGMNVDALVAKTIRAQEEAMRNYYERA